MKRNIIAFFLTVISLMFGTTFEVGALTLDELPTSKTSKQWSVEIGKAQYDNPKDLKPQKDTYNTYSMKIKNIGKDTANVEIEAFRDKENSSTKYELFTSQSPTLIKSRDPFVFGNFPISEKAKELEVIITWTEKGSDKKYKETFVFIQK